MKRDRLHSDSPPPSPASAAPGKITFSLLGGGVAWLLHLIFAYAVAEFGTLSGFIEHQWQGVSLVAWTLLGWSVAMFGLSLAATMVAKRCQQRPTDARIGHSDEAPAVRFSGRLGFITNLVFTGIIGAQTIPIFYFLS